MKVEEKIRYLIRKFPHTEWSGVLFYRHEGNFEDNNLVITCEDIYPMDLGSSAWTEFKMDENVASYIADNIELFDCELGLIHSHHTMGAFFSGQDVKTLQVEGSDTNCFVSLIVDTRGTYEAAITRKIQTKHEVTVKNLGVSYPFFGEGDVTVEKGQQQEVTKIVDKEAIEYFMLDVEREVVDNPLSWLDKRFEEIETKKNAEKAKSYSTTFYTANDDIPASYTPITNYSYYGSSYVKPKEEPKAKVPERRYPTESKTAWYPETTKYKQPSLFDDKTLKELEVPADDSTVWQWYPKTELIDQMVCRILTCSLLANSEHFNAKEWVKNKMVDRYNEVFETDCEFDEWAEFIIEFCVETYPVEKGMDLDVAYSRIAYALIEEFEELTSGLPKTNPYIESYCDVLNRYVTYE